MCISWSYTKDYGKQKILYVQRRRFRSHSHRPRDQSVATEQPLVSRKKFVFSNQLLVGGEAVGCRWVKLVTNVYGRVEHPLYDRFHLAIARNFLQPLNNWLGNTSFSSNQWLPRVTSYCLCLFGWGLNRFKEIGNRKKEP